MMARQSPGAGGLLVVAALNEEQDFLAEDGLPMSWHVDAMLAAIARSAVVRGVPLWMPLDDCFAPFVADIVAEYAAPPEAEPDAPMVSTPEGGARRRPLVFVSLGRTSATRRKVPGLAAMRPMAELGIIDDTVTSLSEAVAGRGLHAAVLIGSGGAVDRALRHPVVRQATRHRWLSAVRDETVAEVDARLAQVRDQIRLFVPFGENQFRKEGELEVPADFWRYPAYPLYADALLAGIDPQRRGRG